MLRRVVAAMFLVALVGGGCSVDLPQATSHSKDPSNIAPCSDMQSLITYRNPNLSTQQTEYVIRLMAASAQRADDAHLRSEGVGLASALATNDLANRGTYLGEMMRTCTQIGLFKFPS
jgi:hypothetical protein